MKKIAVQFILALSLFVITNSGQEKNDWTRIESGNKEISITFPPNFLVDAEKKTYSTQRQRIIAFQNGVIMELTIYNDNDARQNLQIKDDNNPTNKSFTAQGFIGRRYVISDDKIFAQTILLASKKTLYNIFISAKSDEPSEVSRFIYSILLEGKPLFINKKATNDLTEKAVSINDLKTSPEISAALSRRNEKSDKKIEYKTESDAKNKDNDDDSIRLPIILIEPYPVSFAVKPPVYNFRKREGNGKAKLKVKLLANGQIGDITVYSTADRAVLYDFVEGVKTIKFLPAQKDGKPIDYDMVFDIESYGF